MRTRAPQAERITPDIPAETLLLTLQRIPTHFWEGLTMS
jgi:hypothetical protein